MVEVIKRASIAEPMSPSSRVSSLKDTGNDVRGDSDDVSDAVRKRVEGIENVKKWRSEGVDTKKAEAVLARLWPRGGARGRA